MYFIIRPCQFCRLCIGRVTSVAAVVRRHWSRVFDGWVPSSVCPFTLSFQSSFSGTLGQVDLSQKRCPVEASTMGAFYSSGSKSPWVWDQPFCLCVFYLFLCLSFHHQKPPCLWLDRLHRPYEVIPQPKDDDLSYIDSIIVEGWPEQWLFTVTLVHAPCRQVHPSIRSHPYVLN